MIAAIDAHYRDTFARFVCITFEDWSDENPLATHVVELPNVGEYVPGEFYKRELPGMLEVLKKVRLEDLSCIIVDGYVFLDDQERPGLGYRLYEQLGCRIPVVGVAKTRFFENNKVVTEVLRGTSQKPLFITGTGMEAAEAAAKVKAMAGEFRIPHLLKLLDMETKK